MPDLVDSSVEQRCARIRGRMVWILSQLESDVGGNILTDADSKSASSGEQLRAQQQAHERELEEELERQAARLRAAHDAELAELRERLAAQHASELGTMRKELATAKEAARAAGASGQGATREAQQQQQRVAALEACLRQSGPLLSQAAVALPPSDPLAAQLTAAMRSFETLLPGSAPKATAAAAASPALAARPSVTTTPATQAAAPAPPPKPKSSFGKQSLDDAPEPSRSAMIVAVVPPSTDSSMPGSYSSTGTFPTSR